MGKWFSGGISWGLCKASTHPDCKWGLIRLWYWFGKRCFVGSQVHSLSLRQCSISNFEIWLMCKFKNILVTEIGLCVLKRFLFLKCISHMEIDNIEIYCFRSEVSGLYYYLSYNQSEVLSMVFKGKPFILFSFNSYITKF